MSARQGKLIHLGICSFSGVMDEGHKVSLEAFSFREPPKFIGEHGFKFFQVVINIKIGFAVDAVSVPRNVEKFFHAMRMGAAKYQTVYIPGPLSTAQREWVQSSCACRRKQTPIVLKHDPVDILCSSVRELKRLHVWKDT